MLSGNYLVPQEMVHGAGTQTSKRGASANWYWHVSEVWFWQVRKLQPEINLNELFECV